MFEMVSNGESCFRIARTLNEESIPTKAGKKWEARTVSWIVRNTVYIGITYFGKTVGKGRNKTPQETWHKLTDVNPPIISQELFDKAQAALARSKELHPGQALHEYPLTGFASCGICGSPMIGSCLRGNYRYYICRGTHPTASRDKICSAHYIRADWIENAVWDKVKSVLKNPEILLREVQRHTELERSSVSTDTLEHEIKTLNRKLKGYSGQERNLMTVLRSGVATPDIVLDEINQMNQERESDNKKLASLVQTKENLSKLGNFEDNLKELCMRIAPDIENCTNQDKKDAYTYLDLTIKATSEGVDVKGYLDPGTTKSGSCLLTTGQTSGYLHAHTISGCLAFHEDINAPIRMKHYNIMVFRPGYTSIWVF